MNCELPDAQAGFRKGRGTRDQIVYQRSTSGGSSKKQESSRKISTKAFDCVNHNKLWKILQEMGIPEHLTCLLKNLYASQEAIVRTGHGKQIASKSGKVYIKAIYYHPAYLTYM